jgi:hypothetical protein
VLGSGADRVPRPGLERAPRLACWMSIGHLGS